MYAERFYLGACQRPKCRGGARPLAADTPQVLYWAYITAINGTRVCAPALVIVTELYKAYVFAITGGR